MRLIYTFIFLLTSTSLFAQFTWVDDVAPLVYDNCSHCHHEGQVAPFSLMSYADVTENALSMYFALEDGHMPPWPADPEYHHFVGETVVTQEEIDGFLDWVESGMPFGDPDLEPEAPVFQDGGTLLDHVDLVLQVPDYELQTNNEEYRWFVFPTNFPVPMFVNGIEVVAGLEDYVHHCDIFFDTSGNSLANDEADPLPGFNSSTGWPTNNYYMNAWQPGAGPAIYPENWGIEVPPGADLVIEIHFGPGGAEEIDDTKINLQFVQDPSQGVRPIYASWLLGSGSMTDGPLVIPANEVVTFHQESTPFWSDKSLISICPHMHLLGDSYKVWMETPDDETVPLIDIPEWNFHWQFYYTYPYIKKIPGGSVMKTEGVYDNTTMNEDNPNDPPITVWDGALTTDEMFLCYFIYADYEEGDEFISLDPSVGVTQPHRPVGDLSVFPNPVVNEANIVAPMSGMARILVLDSQGKVVISEAQNWTVGQQVDLDMSRLAPGNYNVGATIEDHVWRTSVIRL